MAKNPMLIPRKRRGPDMSAPPRWAKADRATAQATVIRPKICRRHNWTASDAEEILARLIERADVIGEVEGDVTAEVSWALPGTWLLVVADRETMAWLAEFGPADDIEDGDPPEIDDVDGGDVNDRWLNAPGTSEDAEEDDPPEVDDEDMGCNEEEPNFS
ncbi:hypothetical protein [Zavarzinia sp.]|uniref:hypothetical protein n=1 Tax=Zavarzinia sp. TaxID=2027920 RepID=UPI00356A1E4A